MKTARNHLEDEGGMVMVAALMVLALLTIIGFAATHMSSTELNISTNALLYERAFFTAEAALEHGKEVLIMQLNEQATESGVTGNWSFVLNGSAGYTAAADDPNDDLPGTPIVRLIQEDSLNGISYSLRIYDNDDEDPGPQDYSTDVDGLIFIRADAWHPQRGERCGIEELVLGMSTGDATSGYTAQEGAGSGKTYTADDADAIKAEDLVKKQIF